MRYRYFKEILSSRLMLAATVFAAFLIVLIIIGLLQRSLPILEQKSLGDLLFSSSWHPVKKEFGFLPFIMGTIWVTGAAMILAIPLCLLSSIYLAEYMHVRIRTAIKPLIDLLAGIPSVVYGLWGMLVIVPVVKMIAPFFGTTSNGYCVLSGGIVLAIMVFPVIIAISEEVIRNVPYEMRAATLALGAPNWQATKMVVLRGALPGVIAAVILGFSRAFGETMAVLMVVGNTPRVPSSLFDAAYPLTALIANNYGEMMSIPLYDSALMLAAFILLVIVIIFNIGARIVLIRLEKR
jgi:phosphate transport system permease protein